ncbi:MAG: serine hydrolase domain-containing protein [Alphaproteobacteria bacterium]|nr:serine hydrolase domain-containing protein [Alphaproteobacteria bacterium]
MTKLLFGFFFIIGGITYGFNVSTEKAENKAVETPKKIDGIFNVISDNYKEKISTAIDVKLKEILLNKNFNGQILVAKNGQTVYKNYVGYSDIRNRIPFSDNTPIHLASISKTFTGMAVLKLMEQGLLNLDDSINKFFPDFPYQSVSVRMLLCHRSGLPNYENFFDKYAYSFAYRIAKNGKKIKTKTLVKKLIPGDKTFYNNNDVLNYIVNSKPHLYFKPNTKFDYCNTNYVLLALIIEKLSHKSYPDYIQEEIFDKLGMRHSFVLCEKNKSRITPSYHPNNTPYSLNNIDFIYGEKNVYSTVEDLLIWDKNMYSDSLLSAETRELAFSPHNEMRGSVHNYGLAWRMIVNPEEKIIYHNGWWHGNNTVFTRFIKDTVTVIVLGNRFNNNIYKSKAVHEVFTNVVDSSSTIN